MQRNYYFIFIFILTITLSLITTPSLAQNENMRYHNHIPKSQQNQDTLCEVKKGDCLWKIARKHGFKLRTIINANQHFEDPDLIYPGDKVLVPKEQEMKQPQEPAPEMKDPQQPTPQEKEDSTPQNQMQGMKKEVVNLVNQERSKRGLEPYQHHSKLAHVAQKKAEDMRDNNYF